MSKGIEIPAKRTVGKNIAFSGLSIVISLVLFYLVAEVITRIYLGPDPANEGSLYRYSDNDLGTRDYPGEESIFFPNHDAISKGAPVHINNLGLRDSRDRSLTKADSVLRIAIFGDSFTFGRGLKDDETYPAQLESLFSQRFDRERRVEVLNFGSSGFNSTQEYIYLARFGIRFEPDIVLFQWLYNDFHTRGYRKEDLDAVANGDLIARVRDASKSQDGNHNEAGFGDLKRQLSEHSDFYQFILGPRLRSLKAALLDENVGDAYFTNLESRGARLSLRSLQYAADFCANNNLGFGVIIYPGLNTLSSEQFQDKLYSKVEDFCRKEGIAALNLFHAFAGKDPSELVISRRDTHPNAAGQKIVAEAIYHWMSDTFLEQEN